MDLRRRKLLSIIVLVYNEQDNLRPFHARLAEVLDGLRDWEAEVIYTDDGSRDQSPVILRALHQADRRVKILELSRNFGSWSALIAGLHAASGDAAMWISSDLQDPPELIPQLVKRWEEGAAVVWGARAARDDPWPRRVAALLFYKLVRRLAIPGYPPLGTDICLMDRRVAGLFGGLKEHNRFTQGLIMNLGFKQATVSYVRERRHKGHSKWGSFPRLLKIGIDMIVGFSYFPLRLMLYAGLLTTLLTVVAAVVLLVKRVLFDAAIDGWGWLALIVLFSAGLNATMFGILGEYVWRVLDETRGRPLYVIQERVGFAADLPKEDIRGKLTVEGG